jgi:MoaA/NifB/PqqE/SkfB family radical SAM enzyme
MSDRYTTAIKGYLNRSTPGYLILFVTSVCDCRCKMCFYLDQIDNAKNRKIMTFEEIEQIAKNWPGLHQINFSGGEPFLRKDFPKIPALFYQHSGTRFFTTPTNSSHPDRIEKGVAEICESCPDAWIRITQSIDGVGEVHNEIRQKKGLFDCVVDLNGRLDALTKKYSNLSVGINTVFSSYSKDNCYELLDFAYDNLQFTDFGSGFVRGSVRYPEAKDVEGLEYAKFQQECIRRRRAKNGKPNGLASRAFVAVTHTVSQLVMETVLEDKYILPCQAGRRMVVIDDEGFVKPCEILEGMIKEGTSPVRTADLGNMRDFEYDIRKLMGTGLAKEVADDIVKSKCFCTFECAMAVNTIYNPQAWPRVAKNFIAVK